MSTVRLFLCPEPETKPAARRLSNVHRAKARVRSATQEKIMSEAKPVPAKKEDELSEAEIAEVSGGLNPQPLPPSPPPENNRF